MADYIHRFVSHDKGLYIFVGAGLGSVSLKPNQVNYYGESLSGTGICLSAGLGYNITKNIEIEASVITAITSQTHNFQSFPWQQATLKYRF